MRIYSTNSHLFIGSLLLAGMSISASASVVQYTDQVSFSAATSSITTIGFEGIAPTNGDANENGGLTIGGATFVGTDNQFNGADLAVEDAPSGDNWGSGDYLVGPFFHSGGFSRIDVMLPSGIYAVGSNIMFKFFNGTNYTSGPASSFNIVLNGAGTIYTANTVAGYNSMAFTGFVSTTPITEITFYPQSPSSNGVLDNFQFGQAASQQSQTPETSTLLLCGAGLILVAVGWRRKTELATEPRP